MRLHLSESTHPWYPKIENHEKKNYSGLNRAKLIFKSAILTKYNLEYLLTYSRQKAPVVHTKHLLIKHFDHQSR